MRFLLVLWLLGLAACQSTTTPSAPSGSTPIAVLTPASFNDLPGWQNDDLNGFADSFNKTCARMAKAKPKWGSAAGWTAACTAIKNAPPTQLRATIQQYLQPYAITDGDSGSTQGLFTGYYEPLLQGSRTRTGIYQTPIYAIPNDLVTADLGLFRDSLKGQTLIGKVASNKFVPYGKRAEITGTPLNATVLAWVSDPVDAFFLEIQGSGRVQLPDGSMLHIGYAGKNGESYTPIGRALREQGEIPTGAGMPDIKIWLRQHPEKAQAMMNSNESYVFFRELPPSDGPIGGANVTLTAERSLAVDPRAIPYGLPLWIDTPAPMNSGRFQKLIVAQDTGGAIKGTIRGDIFWGFGQSAEINAGSMQSTGSYWALLPKN